jgi:hypothetical protein
MRIRVLIVLAMGLLSTYALGVDGVTLINNATVMAAGGYPYVISIPGSYKLSGNLTNIPLGTSGIQITANNVTLDLNGFSILGQASAGSDIGISNVNSSHTTVMNGTVSGFDEGIKLGSSSRVENVHVTNQSGAGIEVGSTSIVRNNISDSNNGIFVTCPASIVGNVAVSLFGGITTSGTGCSRNENSPTP